MNNKVFNSKKRIAFVGDSVTHGGFQTYQVWLYLMGRFPEEHIQIFNCGTGGDTVLNVINRFDFEIDKLSLDEAFIMLGMNDSNWFVSSNSQKERNDCIQIKSTYEQQIIQLCDKFDKKGIKVNLITPTPFDDTQDGVDESAFKRNYPLFEMAGVITKLSNQRGYRLIDLWGTMTYLNTLLQKQDKNSTLCGSDRVHPSEFGNFIMTYILLSQLGLEKLNPCIKIDKSNGNIASEKAKVENLKIDNDVISFDYSPEYLPFVANESYKAAEKIVPITEMLNSEIISVKGLENGRYQVCDYGVYSAEELENGINISKIEKNPAYALSQDIYDKMLKRRELDLKYREFDIIRKEMLWRNLDTFSSEDLKKFEDEVNTSKAYKDWKNDYAARFKIYRELGPDNKDIINSILSLSEEIANTKTRISYKFTVKKLV